MSADSEVVQHDPPALKIGSAPFKNISDIEELRKKWHEKEMKLMCHDIVNWLNKALGEKRVKHDSEAELCDQLRGNLCYLLMIVLVYLSKTINCFCVFFFICIFFS
jgi:hypothetical protein